MVSGVFILFWYCFLLTVALICIVGSSPVNSVSFDYSGVYLGIGGGGVAGSQLEVKVVKDWSSLVVSLIILRYCGLSHLGVFRLYRMLIMQKWLVLLGQIMQVLLFLHQLIKQFEFLVNRRKFQLFDRTNHTNFPRSSRKEKKKRYFIARVSSHFIPYS